MMLFDTNNYCNPIRYRDFDILLIALYYVEI